jgi:hypothetical protein
MRVSNPCTSVVESFLKAIGTGMAGKAPEEGFEPKLTVSSIVPSLMPLKTRHAILLSSAILGMQNIT